MRPIPTRIASAGELESALSPAAAERLRSRLRSAPAAEVELGFGKGRYLLRRAAAEPQALFLGVELAGEFFRIAARRVARRGLDNLVLVQAEALYLSCAALPPGFARAVHVYFPDPWPKKRHHKRRLFDVETVDLVVRLLQPGGRLYFASDHLDYAAEVEQVLATYPALSCERRAGSWPDGARTNYEAKYVEAGREIRRLEARRVAPADIDGPESPLHPQALHHLLSAW